MMKNNLSIVAAICLVMIVSVTDAQLELSTEPMGSLTYDEDVGTINVTVRLSGPTDTPIMVQIQMVQPPIQATAGADFEPESFADVSFPAFDSNDFTETFSVTIIDDDIVEPTEQIVLEGRYELRSTSGRDMRVSSNMLIISIRDNDNILVDFTEDFLTTREPLPLMFCLTVVSGNFERAVEVDATFFSVTASEEDFVALPLSFTFSSMSNTTLCRVIGTFDDDLIEDTEELSIRLSGSADAQFVRSAIDAFIEDADGAMVAFYNRDPAANQSNVIFMTEGEEDTEVELCLQLILEPGTTLEREANFTLSTQDDGSGLGNFIPDSDVAITFAAETESGSLACGVIVVLGDVTFESSFNATFEAVNVADTIQGPSVVTVVIQDNDNSTTIDCGILLAPANGDVVLEDGTEFPSNASYSCDEGFNLTGMDTRTCLSSGNWSGSEPECIIVDCGDLVPPVNGSIEFSSPLTVFGTVAVYSCILGYASTQPQRECLASGVWSGTDPTCEVVDCGILDSLENGLITYSTNDTGIGAVATHVCSTGYMLVALASDSEGVLGNRTCLGSGEWSGTTLICQAIDCGSLLAPANGDVMLDGTVFLSNAAYSCNEGFDLRGTQSRTCLISGNWSETEPVCSPVDCGPLVAPANGSITFSSPLTVFGTVATYICMPGFILSIAPRTDRVCLATGLWAGGANNDPTCDAVDCGVLAPLENGLITYSTEGTTFGTLATHVCIADYMLVANVSGSRNVSADRVCAASGTWSGTTLLCTEVVRCEILIAPEQGSVETSAQEEVGSEAMYRCNDSYILQGNQTRVCMQTGEWTGTMPSCLPAPTVSTFGLNVNFEREVELTITLLTSIGGSVVAVVVNVFLISLVVYKCRRMKRYNLDDQRTEDMRHSRRETYVTNTSEFQQDQDIPLQTLPSPNEGATVIDNPHIDTTTPPPQDASTETATPPASPEEASVIENVHAESSEPQDLQESNTNGDINATTPPDSRDVLLAEEVIHFGGVGAQSSVSGMREEEVGQVSQASAANDAQESDQPQPSADGAVKETVKEETVKEAGKEAVKEVGKSEVFV